jgi:hypothetical protein
MLFWFYFFFMTSVLFSGQDIPALNAKQQRRVDWVLEFVADKSDLAQDIRDFDLLVTRGRIHKHLGYRVAGSWAPKKKADPERKPIPEEFPREMFPEGKRIPGKGGHPERKRVPEKELPEKKKSPEKRRLLEKGLPEKKVIPGGKKSPKKVIPEKRAVPAMAVSRKAVPEMGETAPRSEARQESGGLNASPNKARKKPALDKGNGKMTEEMLHKEKEITVLKLMSSAIRSYRSKVPLPKPKANSTMEEVCGASDFEPIVLLKVGAPSKVSPPKSDSEDRDPGGGKRSRDDEVPIVISEKRPKIDHARYFDDILDRHLTSHSMPDLGEANIVPTSSSTVAPVGDGLSGSCVASEEVPLTYFGHRSPPLEDEVAVQPAAASVKCPTRETPTDGGSGSWGPLLSSLGNGLVGHPLQALSNIIPQGHSRGAGCVSLEKFIDLLMHQKIAVSFFLFC